MQTTTRRPAFGARMGAFLAGWLLLAPDLATVALAMPVRSLSGIDVKPDQVTLNTEGPVDYRAFLVENPPRLVVDLLDTTYDIAKKTPGQGSILQSIHGGQYKSSPQQVSRVVMLLAQDAAYKVASLPTGLLVTIGDASATAAKAATGTAPAAAAPVDLYRDAPAPAADAGEMPPSVQTATKVGVPAQIETPRPSSTGKDIMSSLPREKVNLDFDSTDVRDILKLLAVRAGINIIYGGDVSGALSLHLKQVPFNEAFATVLQMSGLTSEQVGDNILRVMTPEVLKTERGKALPTTKVFALSYTNAAEVKTQVDAVRQAEGRPGASVVAKTANDLIVTDTQEGLLQVERLIAQIDKRPIQVLIEAKLIEIQHNKSMNLGVQWEYMSNSPQSNGSTWFTGTQNTGTTTPNLPNGGPFSATALTANTPTNRGTGVFLPATNIAGALTLGRITSTSFLAATLSASAAQGKAKVLSDPKVATLNNQQATINITTQIPYVTSSVASTGVATQAVTYISEGITLTVTPTVNADGRVTLKINPVVSQPSATPAAAGTTGAPAVDQRTADTTVLVRDGETIVIGGLIQDTESITITKVPILGDIPLIGLLFRKTDTSRVRNELLVFVTPKILPD